MEYIKTSDGTNIAVYDRNRNGRNVIVLVHGWPLSSKIFEYQQSMLIEQDYRVVSLDLRGFGESDAPEYGYDYNTLAKDVYEVVMALNIHSFVLVGFSMGGAICMRYMKNYKGYGVRKLVLLAAAAPCFTKRAGFQYGVTKESVDELIHAIRTDRPQFCKEFSEKLFASKQTDAFKNYFNDISLAADGYATLEAGYSLRNEDCREDMSYINVPTGIFHGVRDSVVPYELGLIQRDNIPNSILYTFENSSHGIFADELERFNDLFLDFIRK